MPVPPGTDDDAEGLPFDASDPVAISPQTDDANRRMVRRRRTYKWKWKTPIAAVTAAFVVLVGGLIWQARVGPFSPPGPAATFSQDDAAVAKLITDGSAELSSLTYTLANAGAANPLAGLEGLDAFASSQLEQLALLSPSPCTGPAAALYRDGMTTVHSSVDGLLTWWNGGAIGSVPPLDKQSVSGAGRVHDAVNSLAAGGCARTSADLPSPLPSVASATSPVEVVQSFWASVGTPEVDRFLTPGYPNRATIVSVYERGRRPTTETIIGAPNISGPDALVSARACTQAPDGSLSEGVVAFELHQELDGRWLIGNITIETAYVSVSSCQGDAAAPGPTPEGCVVQTKGIDGSTVIDSVYPILESICEQVMVGSPCPSCADSPIRLMAPPSTKPNCVMTPAPDDFVKDTWARWGNKLACDQLMAKY